MNEAGVKAGTVVHVPVLLTVRFVVVPTAKAGLGWLSVGTTVLTGATPVIVSDAVPVLPALVPVTVCTPTVGAVQPPAVQSPSGAMVNVAATLPRVLLNSSNPSAVYAWRIPAWTDAVAGVSTR